MLTVDCHEMLKLKRRRTNATVRPPKGERTVLILLEPRFGLSLFQRLPDGLYSLSTECRESLSEICSWQGFCPVDARVFGTEVHVGHVEVLAPP